MKTSIHFNPNIKLILADVDETIADVYCPAESDMIVELIKLLKEERSIFFVTGGSFKRVKKDIIDFIPTNLRYRIIVSHCSGAEVWGFDTEGEVLSHPFDSKYHDSWTNKQKQEWRKIVNILIKEFKLNTHNVMPKLEFIKKYGNDPREIMLDDRGPQITFEFINASDLSVSQRELLEVEVPETHGQYDLRIPVLERAMELFEKFKIPASPRLGGTMALDFAIQGVSKTTSVHQILNDHEVINHIGLSPSDLKNPLHLEIWGDKFSTIRGGTDRHMSEAVDKKIRSIDFRDENPDEFLEDYNIVVWDGARRLHHGTLEYLQSRD